MRATGAAAAAGLMLLLGACAPAQPSPASEAAPPLRYSGSRLPPRHHRSSIVHEGYGSSVPPSHNGFAYRRSANAFRHHGHDRHTASRSRLPLDDEEQLKAEWANPPNGAGE